MGELINIESVLNENLIELHLKGKNKDEVLKEMVKLLYDDGRIDNYDAFLEDVYLREEEGLTGIGDAIAIPHGKSDSVKFTSAVIGRLDNDINWNSLDGKPVRLVIMLAIKSFDKTTHIRLLSKIATSLCDKEIVKKLFEVEDKKKVISYLSQG